MGEFDLFPFLLECNNIYGRKVVIKSWHGTGSPFTFIRVIHQIIIFPLVNQCADIIMMAFGLGKLFPNIARLLVNRLDSTIFIGEPCPIKSTGIFRLTTEPFLCSNPGFTRVRRGDIYISIFIYFGITLPERLISHYSNPQSYAAGQKYSKEISLPRNHRRGRCQAPPCFWLP